jgi:hypothetical protein
MEIIRQRLGGEEAYFSYTPKLICKVRRAGILVSDTIWYSKLVKALTMQLKPALSDRTSECLVFSIGQRNLISFSDLGWLLHRFWEYIYMML